jgi:hypothetical protein
VRERERERGEFERRWEEACLLGKLVQPSIKSSEDPEIFPSMVIGHFTNRIPFYG